MLLFMELGGGLRKSGIRHRIAFVVWNGCGVKGAEHQGIKTQFTRSGLKHCSWCLHANKRCLIAKFAISANELSLQKNQVRLTRNIKQVRFGNTTAIVSRLFDVSRKGEGADVMFGC